MCFKVCGERHLRFGCWALFFLAQYFLVGPDVFRPMSAANPWAAVALRYHVAICFTVYIVLLAAFVLRLRENFIKR